MIDRKRILKRTGHELIGDDAFNYYANEHIQQ